MDRRTFLHVSAGLGCVAAFPRGASGQSDSRPTAVQPLVPPAHDPIPVAFLISRNAVVIDFTGPWEVFQDVRLPTRGSAFQLYTVAETSEPVRASGGLTIVPNYSFATAPAAKLIVVPAQGGATDTTLEWLRDVSKRTDVTMSVCTGALLLAKTGLFNGKAMTTHHGAYGILAAQSPGVTVIRGARFVDNGNLASSGGLTSGIDLALHIVERYFGHEVAVRTTEQLEYQGLGWTDPDSNRVFAPKP